MANKAVKFLVMLLLLASVSFAQTTQTSNPVTLTGVATPAAPVITVSGPAISPTGKYYCSNPFTITVTTTSGTYAAGAVINWNSTALVTTTVNSTTLTAPVTAAQATCAANVVTVVQPLPALTLNTPVSLPNAAVGTPYSADLGSVAQVQGGIQPYTFSLDPSSSLPTGLSLSAGGTVSGTPSGAGSFSFTYLVKDSSGLAQIKKATVGVGGKTAIYMRASGY